MPHAPHASSAANDASDSADPFQAQLRSALSHLADVDSLNAHPLAQRLPAGVTHEPPGLRLRAFLLGLIEQMKPSPEVAETSSAWRYYVILRDRYTLQRPLWEIGTRMALGERQVRREHQRAARVLAALAAAQLNALQSASSTPTATPLEEAVQRLTPAPRVFGLAGLLEDVVAVVTQSLKHGGDGHADAPALHIAISSPTLSVFADRGILHQLLLRLVQLFVRHASGSVRLNAQPSLASEQQVEITVSSPSARLPAAEAEDVRLCRWLADSLNAPLTFEHNTAALVLPLGAALRTVLIVDDEPAAIELFRGYLSGLNYNVVSETKPEAALTRALEIGPHLILIDVMMPAMDGWELLQRLRHTPALHHVPVVACSVLNDADLAQALGATRFLKKPILRQHLLRTLNEVLDADTPDAATY